MVCYVGLDWGGSVHAVCVINEKGEILAQFTVGHDAEGLAELVRRLKRLGPGLTIAIERPSGLLVDTLVEAGLQVVPIHPNVVKACRPRYRAAGGKSDRGDAYLLADVLRTDGHRFRSLQRSSDEIRTLRSLVRSRDDLVQHRLRAANQLRALLESFWPGAAMIFADIDSGIALAFLDRYPTPESASRLGEKRLGAFLIKHHYCGRKAPAVLLDRLRSAPTGLATKPEAEAKGELVKSLVAILKVVVAELARITRRIELLMAQLPDGKIVMSFPRAGRVCAAQILAELGDERARFPTPDQLAAEAGVVPVTHESGKHRATVYRWACNRRLKQAVCTFADNSRHGSEWAADVYRRARARGCDHPHSIRILARSWIRVLWRAWTSKKPYDVALHRAATQLASPA